MERIGLPRCDPFLASRRSRGTIGSVVVYTKLSDGISSAEGWKTPSNENEDIDKMAHRAVYTIQTKAKCICAALKCAVLHKPIVTWQECLEYSIQTTRKLAIDKIERTETIQQAHREFRLNGECFINPSKEWLEREAALLEMRDNNPDLTEALVAYATENLPQLSSEVFRRYLRETVFPVLLKQVAEERAWQSNHYSMKMDLPRLCFFIFCVALVDKVGVHKKTYYMDINKWPDTIAYREKFVGYYLRNEGRWTGGYNWK